MTDAEQLVAAVRARTEGTPYVVAETANGFDVQLDLQNASWYGPLSRQHVSRTWIYHVKMGTEAKTFSVTDDVFAVKWRAGVGSGDGALVPALGVGLSRSLGRMNEYRFQKTFSLDGEVQHEEAPDFTFSSSEGRNLIREPARELGWTEHRGVAERIGLYVGVSTIVLLILGGIGVGIAALMGAF